MSRIARTALTCLVLALILPPNIRAATRTWTGTASNLWSDGANWQGGVLVAPR